MKVVIATLPALVFGLLLDDWIDAHMMNAFVVALMLILYGIGFLFVEDYKKGTKPKAERLSQLTIPMTLAIGGFQVLALIPGTSRSGATILGGLLTFFLAIPVMFGASFLKVLKFGFHFTVGEFFLLLLGCAVSFGVSVVAIKFLMGYIKKHDFTVFGYYRIVLGIIVLLYFGIKALI